MRKLLLIVAIVMLSAVFFGCNQETTASSKGEITMKVSSSGITNGVIDDKYGVNGGIMVDGMPSISLPLKIENAPANTVSYAIIMEDKDAFPVSHGFSWVHWTAANITDTVIPENASRNSPAFVQGVNSWWSPQGGNQAPDKVSFYGGMYPPASGVGSGPHTYEIHVYALDAKLDLQNGFMMNDLYHKMQGHILGQYTLTGTYTNKGM